MEDWCKTYRMLIF